MPCFRGVEVSLHASCEAKQLPEYPHPDGSSVRLLKAATALGDPHTQANRTPRPKTSPSAEDVDPTRQKKVNPLVSVYIPSLSGEQFWLRYLINQSPPPSRCIFFKMAVNGRHVTSWGINTNACCTGSVVRALYEPGDRWRSMVEDNEIEYPGIETRYFHFMPGLDNKSVAEDGGLIEVQVFRCKGRKRIAAKLHAYRDQERYGITSPSGGLVDNPEDATYYNYYLIDARDSPYATFRFHYRSMKHLKQLNLIPQREPIVLPAPNSPTNTLANQCNRESRTESASPSPPKFAFGIESLEPQVFDDGVRAASADGAEQAEYVSEECFLKSPAELLPSSLRYTAAGGTNKASRGELPTEIVQRPLPEVPRSCSRPSSASSLRSNCPSLTPSLRQYVESDDFENEDIRLSTAQPLLIPSESMQALELVSTGADEGTSLSDYATSPSSTETSQSQLPSPEGYIPTTGSVLERLITQYDSPLTKSSPSRGQEKMRPFGAESALSQDENDPRTSTLNLTEAEWLRHTPSPLQRRSTRAECLWSSHSEVQPARILLEEIPGVSEEGAQTGPLRQYTMPNNFDEADQAPMGNWI
ncbi:hypothetical protein F5Y19DRAFT_465675 [Xylariaceae sp. FL1651]|nr:hypothetical protein F5Y19DRAFT_465675 [Xylariaceae sp. FL1651]